MAPPVQGVRPKGSHTHLGAGLDERPAPDWCGCRWPRPQGEEPAPGPGNATPPLSHAPPVHLGPPGGGRAPPPPLLLKGVGPFKPPPLSATPANQRAPWWVAADWLHSQRLCLHQHPRGHALIGCAPSPIPSLPPLELADWLRFPLSRPRLPPPGRALIGCALPCQGPAHPGQALSSAEPAAAAMSGGVYGGGKGEAGPRGGGGATRWGAGPPWEGW